MYQSNTNLTGHPSSTTHFAYHETQPAASARHDCYRAAYSKESFKAEHRHLEQFALSDLVVPHCMKNPDMLAKRILRCIREAIWFRNRSSIAFSTDHHSVGERLVFTRCEVYDAGAGGELSDDPMRRNIGG